jgi:hypothetical protein
MATIDQSLCLLIAITSLFSLKNCTAKLSCNLFISPSHTIVDCKKKELELRMFPRTTQSSSLIPQASLRTSQSFSQIYRKNSFWYCQCRSPLISQLPREHISEHMLVNLFTVFGEIRRAGVIESLFSLRFTFSFVLCLIFCFVLF